MAEAEDMVVMEEMDDINRVVKQVEEEEVDMAVMEDHAVGLCGHNGVVVEEAGMVEEQMVEIIMVEEEDILQKLLEVVEWHMETMVVEQVQQVLVLAEFVFCNIIYNGVR